MTWRQRWCPFICVSLLAISEALVDIIKTPHCGVVRDALLQTVSWCNYSRVNKVLRVSYTPSFLPEAKPATPLSLFLGESKTTAKACEINHLSWLRRRCTSRGLLLCKECLLNNGWDRAFFLSMCLLKINYRVFVWANDYITTRAMLPLIPILMVSFVGMVCLSK